MTATNKRRWLRLVALLAVVAMLAGCGGSGAGQARLQEMAQRAERLGNDLRAMAEDLPRQQLVLADFAEILSWQNPGGRRAIVHYDFVAWNISEIEALLAGSEPGAMIDQRDRFTSQPHGSRGTRSGGVSTDWVRWVWHFGIRLPEGYEEEGRALAQSWADYLLDSGEWHLNRPGASGRFIFREGLTVISLYQETPEGRWTIEIWDRPVEWERWTYERFVAVDVEIRSPETRV